MSYAPILLFVYKRLDTLKQTIAALQQNELAKESDLFIFSDAAKKTEDIAIIDEVRNFIHTIGVFKSVTIHAADKNKGLATSIISGVTQMINQYDKVIVLEDDLVTSSNFLSFMNKALEFYERNEKVFSIAGYSAIIKNPMKDVYFTYRGSSWGWATWKNRWNEVDWDMGGYEKFRSNPSFKRDFNKMGSDMYKMLEDQVAGRINSWAIRWTYHQFLVQKLTVFPSVSKIQNIGTGEGATHTRDSFNRFKTVLDTSDKTDFDFDEEVKLDNHYLKHFLKQYSITTRIKYKILNTLKF